MKNLILIPALILSLSTLAQEKVTLEVQVKGLLNEKGSLNVSLFDSEENYLKSAVAEQRMVLAGANEKVFKIDGIAPGKYAVVVLHDENENGQIDFGPMGPTEGYGFSNNPMAMYGPAKFDEAVMEIKEDSSIEIILN